jgi:hypothetical protein
MKAVLKEFGIETIAGNQLRSLIGYQVFEYAIGADPAFFNVICISVSVVYNI